MQNQQINKLKGIVGIANKAGYIVFGADNLKQYSKKLYLVVKSDDIGKNSNKVVDMLNIDCVVLEKQVMQQITNSENCKIFAIRNKGLSEQILKIIRGENIG